ncbi:hypothetical protein XENOCAPTIV_019299, partial [Xenoophorus captivus]
MLYYVCSLFYGSLPCRVIQFLTSFSCGTFCLKPGAMVSLAQNWTKVGPQHQCVLTMLTEPRDIGNKLVFSKSVDACWGQPEYVRSLEHAQARLTLSHNQRGKLAIHLISPLGTRSTLLFPRPNDYSSEGFNDWAFMTTHSWDEDPQGEWTLEIENVAANGRDYEFILWLCLLRAAEKNEIGALSLPVLVSILLLSCVWPRSHHLFPLLPPPHPLLSQFTLSACVEYCEVWKGCVKFCPPGFTSGPQLLNLSLENWVDLSSVQACLPCHSSCLTCSGPGPTDCLSCPPHSHLVLTSCLHQNQVQRKSPLTGGLQGKEAEPEVKRPAGADNNSGEAEEPPGLSAAPPSQLPVIVAVLSCAFILAAFVGVFFLLQVRSGDASLAWRTKLPCGFSDTRRTRLGLGLTFQQGRERKARICYKGIPTVWADEDMIAYESESDSEEVDGHSERTAFIKTQSLM